MEPVATTAALDFSPERVIPVVLFGVAVVIIGAVLRHLVMAYGDELKVLWDEYGPIALGRLLEKRDMPQTPWYCARCHSHNARGHARCYSCGAARADAEMAAPNADAPAGPSAGLSQRNRR